VSDFCDSHRFPRARVDPLDDDAARLIIGATIASPRRPETVVVLLDHQRCGVAIVNVANTPDPDAIHDVASICVAAADRHPTIGGVVLATVRPDGGDELDDVERWLDLDVQLADVGVELVEWYIYGRSISRPRVLVGEATRWAA
jgi:hypothetical protein